MLRNSGVQAKMLASWAPVAPALSVIGARGRACANFCVYSDGGYAADRFNLTPIQAYPGAPLSPLQAALNQESAKLRVLVENSFAKINKYFGYFDAKKKGKVARFCSHPLTCPPACNLLRPFQQSAHVRVWRRDSELHRLASPVGARVSGSWHDHRQWRRAACSC